jgi:hypothetical protein
MTHPFKIGDTVYVANHGNQKKRKQCPCCFTKCEVKLTLGDGTELMLPCDYCGKGYDSPTGYVMEHAAEASVEVRIVRSVSSNTNNEGTEYSYSLSDNYHGSHSRTFGTQAEAAVCAQKLSEEHNSEMQNTARHIKHNMNKTYSWNAGYHRREAKRCRTQAEYHDGRVTICKLKATTKGDADNE